MFASGTLVNGVSIIAGGILGTFFSRLLNKKARESLMKICGLCTLFIALQGGLPLLDSDRSIIILILSLALGSVIGEALDIEGAFERFGEWLKQKSGSQNDQGFVHGFLTASFTVCIGAMAIVGALEDGLLGNPSILYAKSILDFIIVFILAGSMSKGVIFSFIPVMILQGSVTLLAFALSGLFTTTALAYLSLCGSVMIFAVGVNLIWPGTFRVANQLPALLIALLFSWLPI